MAKNEMIMLTAAKRGKPNKTPIWIEVQMLIVPAHKKLQEQYGFDGIVRNAELAAHATVVPVTELGVDAAILFSDLLVPEPEESMKIWLETIRIAKKELSGKAPIIGWVGAPFCLGAFMVEGGVPAPFYNIKKM